MQWLERVYDIGVLRQIDTIKKRQKWSDTHDFDEEWEKGLTPEEFKKEMHRRIAAYPWKK